MGITIKKHAKSHDMYEVWSKRLSTVIHEDDVLDMVDIDTYRRLDNGEELHFKLVEVEWVNKLEQFIKNGVEFGYINIPEEGDPARDIIDEIIGDK